MIFSCIKIVNFFSIGDSGWIDLKDLGLVLVTGDNRDSNAADSNGSGKSTLFEALVWCLWGKTARGQSGDSVIRRTVKGGTEVHVGVLDGDQEYVISRYRKHKKFKNKVEFSHYTQQGPMELTKGTNAQTQESIDEVLGIDYDTFIRGPMLPQGSIKRFSQLTDAEVKAVLETALQVGVLSRAHSEAKDKHQAMTQGVMAVKGHLDGVEAGLEQAWGEKKRWAEQEGLWLTEQLQRLSRAARTAYSVQESIDLAWEALQPVVDVSEAVAARDKVVSLGGRKLGEWAAREAEGRQLLQEAHALSRVELTNIERLKEEIRRIHDLGDEVACPTCRQPISEEHTEECIAPIQSLLDQAIKDHTAARTEEDRLRSESADLNRERHDIEEKIRKFREEAEQQVVEATRAVAEQERREETLCLLEDQMVEARMALEVEQESLREGNPITIAIDEVDLTIEDLSKQREELTTQMEELETGRQHLAFWLDGFSNSGLKSHVLAQVTPFMNLRAKIYAQDLADGEIDIKFNTQTQLKTGEWREKFFVDVSNENGSDTYNGNSDGEKARADLAINFTVSDVVASRSKKAYPQRWFDEPFDSLDETGVEAVMEMLNKMVKECGTIFVVTHRPDMKALFNKTLNVIKENGESRIET
jgi:DNA repair exonuclease SbcCD ATPase subunit